MSNSKKIFEISLTSLSQNGLSCKNIQIDWEKPSCANIKCDFDGKKIKVTVPDGCEGECIYATVRCEDKNCSDCPDSERIKICPCTTSADCEDCNQCVDNLCVSKCPEDQFCDNDRCVDCSEDVPCPCNQVCVAGECQCPPNKPFKNDKGCCVDCLTDGDCPPCTICTPEGCIPIDCPDGACDPETGGCVDCLNTGDCSGENECCVGKSCDCCPGFVRDPFTGKCIPAPDCSIDSDCGECEICVDGICEPIECPEGYICVGGECKPICDCAEPTCSKTEACVNLDPNNCFCNECEGDCNGNEDCGPGCYCKDGKCIPKPCKGACDNGADCGEGCGCQDGECVPCDSLDCTTNECETVLGCNCTAVGCRDIGGCEGACSSSNDCGEGCTCYQGECVPCGDFPCDPNDCDTKPGCACNGGNCEGDGNDCEDTFEVTKLDEVCDLKADLDLKESCSCSKLTAYTTLKSVFPISLIGYTDPRGGGATGYRLAIDAILAKGAASSLAQAKTLSKLGDISKADIAHNETPDTGTIKVLVQPFFDEFNEDGRKVATNVPGDITETSISFSNISVTDTASFTNITVPSPGSALGDFLVVNKVTVKVQQSTDLVFPNNCTYDSIVMIDSFTISDRNESILERIIGGENILKHRFEGYTVLESDDLRYPLFTWFRSTDGTYTPDEIIRKIYIPETSVGKYTDTLFGPIDAPLGKYPLVPEEGGVRSGKYFSVKNDCSCEPEADLGKVVFCNPSELFFEPKECNTKVEILQPFEPCSVNSDLTQYGINDPSSQVKYELFLNGISQGLFVDSEYGMVTDGTTNSMFREFDLGGVAITEIKMVINHDDKDECTLIYSLEDVSNKDIKFDKDCRVVGSQYFVFFPKSGSDYTITNIEIASGQGSVTVEPTRYKVLITKGVDAEVLVTFDDNCQRLIPFSDDCCEEFSKSGFDFTRVSNNRDTILDLALNITGGVGPYQIVYTTPIQTFTYDTSTNSSRAAGPTDPGTGAEQVPQTPNSGPATVIKLDDTGLTIRPYDIGQYSAKVTDSLGCTKTIVLNIDKINTPIIKIDGFNDICAGEETQVNLTGDASAANGRVRYIDGGANQIIDLDSFGKATIPNISTSRSFNFQDLTVDSYVYDIDEQVDIDLISNPSATISTNNNTLCLGDSTDLLITGTVGATVAISNYGSVDITDTAGTVITVTPTQTTTYAISSVTFNSCVTGSGNSVNIIVNPPVSITLLSDECSTDLTTRTLTFDNVTSATDQSGNPITVTNNSVTVDPNSVTQVNITYTNAFCTKIESFTVVSCECPPIGYTLIDQGTICEGSSSFAQPVVINLAQTGNDIEVTDVNGNIVATQFDVGTQFTLTNISTVADSGLQLFVKIINNTIPSCFVENISVVPFVDAVAQPFITLNSDTCINELVDFYTNTVSGATYQWTVTNLDNNLDYTPNNNTSYYLDLNTPDAGQYEIELSVTNANGCSSTRTEIFDFIDCCANINPQVENDCTDKKLDIVFLVDNSGSVDTTERASVIQGVNDLVSSISADVSDSRFALMKYRGTAEVVTSYVTAGNFNYTNADWGGNLGSGTQTQIAYETLQTELTGALSPRSDADLVVILVSDDGKTNYTNLGTIATNIENVYSGRNVVIQFDEDNTLFRDQIATTLTDYYYEQLFSNFPDITDAVINCELSVTGACSGATYLWSTGATTPTITVETSGTYTVDVTCSSCSYNLSITV